MSRIEGKVVRIFSQTKLAINVGTDAGVTMGMNFTLHSVPMAVKDVNGSALGSVTFNKGRVIVTGAFKLFSIVETEKVAAFHPRFEMHTSQVKLSVRGTDWDKSNDPDEVRVGDAVVSEELPDSAEASDTAGKNPKGEVSEDNT